MTCQFCNTEHQAAVPAVHLNGTPAQALFDGLTAALDALHEAQLKLCQAAPNGRDYYPQGDRAMAAAMEQHERRWLELNRMLRELEEQRDHVAAVIDFQAAARRGR